MRTKLAFHVNYIFFATVPPHDEEKKYRHKLLKYRTISSPGQATNYLFDIFDKASDDCIVEILFKSDQNQNNTIRSLLLGLAQTNKVEEKEKFFVALAKKMYDVSDHRNGMGLFVLIEGKKAKETRLMLCRFKGADGLHNDGDSLQYLKQVFTKQNHHYKLAVFQDILSKKSFWTGYAIDRQNSATNYKPFSYFWIEDFLQAETAITDPQGTSQFSKIIKNVLNNISDIQDKEQIISAILNLKSKGGQRISVKTFSKQYLTENLQKKIEEQTSNNEFFETEFGLDADVFQNELGNTVLVLEDGVTAFVPTFSYKDHVIEKNLQKGLKRITIEGVLKDKKINLKRNNK
jgi:hypothetical protein